MSGRRAVGVLSVALCVLATLGGGGISPAAAAERSPSGKDPVQIALAHLAAHHETYGLSAADVDEVVVSDVVPALRDATVVYLQQRHAGVDIFNGISNVLVASDGSVLNVASRFVGGMAKIAPSPTPKIADREAAAKAASALGLTPTEAFAPDGAAAGPDRARSLNDGGISTESIPVRLVYQVQDDGTVDLAWDLQISTLDGQDMWQIRMDAGTGQELDRNNLVSHENDGTATAAVEGVGGGSYDVYDAPLEAPSFGPRTVVADPADGAASPFGWHDTNGVAGAESTLTLGNNVSAYTDTDNNNAPDPGSQPDGGAGLSFDFPIDLSLAPSTYRPAAVSNLFYWNNHIHDVFYAYGFNEASGNFQTNNYGHGGSGGDAVRAEAQDGGGTNNANFATPVDGSAPRMQMYTWTSTVPNRDGDLDNGIITHEYGHGISTRLTGGPANSSCLNNNEQGGEGWSDWFALMLTMKTSDVGTTGRGIGTYALGQPTTGVGIRAFPYSTSLGTDPRTYDAIKTAAIPHGVGSVWAAMLWEVTWGLIAEHGFDPDLIGGTAGNNMALQLVVDGLKLQPCSPGFVDARNAIILADQNDNAGANECVLWAAFAKRGLGFSAVQGSTNSSTDGTQAFDLPPDCLHLSLTKTAAPDPVPAGGELTFTLTATNNSDAAITGVEILDPVPSNTTYVPGSASCGGILVVDTVQMDAGTLAPGASQACSFRVIVDSSPVPGVVFSDGFDPDASSWTTTHGAGTLNFALSTVTPNSPPNSMFATDPAVVSDQYLTTLNPLSLTGDEVLKFSHSRSLELGFDGGVVEASTNGGATWVDIGVDATQNGYTNTISSSFGSPISGRQAFSGSSAGYIQTIIPLSSLAGTNALLRFRTASDTSVAATGWRIDDVQVAIAPVVANDATASDAEGDTAAASSRTDVVAPTVPGAPTIGTATPYTKSSVRLSWTAPASNGGSPITGYRVTPYIAGVPQTPILFDNHTTRTVIGLSPGVTYTFTVAAINAIGTGAESGASNEVTPATVPLAPTIGTATAGSGEATVSWTVPAFDGGLPITGYVVTPYIGLVPLTATTFSSTATTQTVTGLTPGTTYRFRVQAINGVGTGAFSKASNKIRPT